MKFTELDLPGVWVIESEAQIDDRGAFRRHFCTAEFSAHGIAAAVEQGNISENPQTGTLRGFHFQIAPYDEAKTLSCLTGALYDVVVDLRSASPMFMKWRAVEISGADRRSLHVPAGCANAWLTLAPDTVVHYYMSKSYEPVAGRGFRYDDPAFKVRWPSAPLVMSDKDRSYPNFTPSMLT